MSGEDNGDDGYRVGKNKPPKDRQFTKGTSANPRGRPPKRQIILVPNDIRRTIVKLLGEMVEIKSSSGVRKVTLFEAIYQRVLTGAANGNPTQLRFAMKLIEGALFDRKEAHPAVSLTDLLQDIAESSPDGSTAIDRATLKDMISFIKKKL